jgi:hypothetical protein
MELQDKERDRMLQDHEVRITRLEESVIEITTELRLLSQRVDALPGQVTAIVKAQLAESLMEWRKEYDAKLVQWGTDYEAKLDGKLGDWRKENDRKLDDWRKENDRKLDDWRTENDVRLGNWRAEIDRKLADWETRFEARLASQGKWFRWIAGLLVAIFLAVIAK